jgi:hypothetical protein
MTRRWIVDAIGEAPYRLLASELSASKAQSVWLDVIHQRAAARTPAQVLAQYERDTFSRPGVVDQRTAVEIDGHLLAAASAFEAIELSPLAPLGTCSTVAVTDQNRTVSAVRSLEVVSDPTNLMALECAARLQASRAPVHLATCQRVVRAQPVPDIKGFTQSFRMFALASGGFETKDHGFTVGSMVLHITSCLAGLARLEQHGYEFGARSLDLLATPERIAIADRIANELAGVLPVRRAPLEHGYYSGGVRFKLNVTAPGSAGSSDGSERFLIDGGAFDWLSKLLSNRRAVFIATGGGSQLMATFKR